MTITVFSFITSVLLCNVYIIFISLIRGHSSFLIRFSPAPLTFMIIAGIFRLICFVEFPVTIVIGSEVILPAIFDFFTIQLLNTYNDAVIVHIYDVLIGIWIIGSIYNLQRYLHQSIRLNKSIRSVQGIDDMGIISCMDMILSKSRKSAKIKIIQSDEISIPMIAGFFRPVILLPDIEFSDNELKNILLHEWTHFLHKDAWVKLSMYLISSIFWWNPFVHLLRYELNHILEIQCDLNITSKMDKEARIDYLSSILKVIRETDKNISLHTIPMNCAALVSTNKTKKIEQRFRLVLDYDSCKKQRILPVFLLCVVILLSIFASYIIVLQPIYSPSVESSNEEIFDINPENSYLIVNENGTYSLYSDGKYRCDITKINEAPFSSLPIKYSNKNDSD